MKLENYNLYICKKKLLSNVNIEFSKGTISHILGKNGVGKSVFAKDLVLSRKDIAVIASYSNLPSDITMKELKALLLKKFNKEKIEYLCKLLNTSNIDSNIILKKLSDGQKQKLKILTFLLFDKDIIVLDEMTNALDKGTKEIYQFFNSYSMKNPNKIIINITHNLSDLSNMKGNYYLFSNYKIAKFDDKEELIKIYIDGEL